MGMVQSLANLCSETRSKLISGTEDAISLRDIDSTPPAMPVCVCVCVCVYKEEEVRCTHGHVCGSAQIKLDMMLNIER